MGAIRVCTGNLGRRHANNACKGARRMGASAKPRSAGNAAAGTRSPPRRSLSAPADDDPVGRLAASESDDALGDAGNGVGLARAGWPVGEEGGGESLQHVVKQGRDLAW